MKTFTDTADVTAIRRISEAGLIGGITTNPSLIAKSGGKFLNVVAEIAGLVDGPVSAEVAATDYDTTMKETAVHAAIAPNVVIKLPLTTDGLRACRALPAAGHQTNVTLCFSVNQALLAAKAGAT